MNEPLQQRSGFNEGQQPAFLTQIRYAGLPAKKLVAGRNVIIAASPEAQHPRALAFDLVPSDASLGSIFNYCGEQISYRTGLIDANGNEFLSDTMTLGDGLNIFMLAPFSTFCLPPGWRIVVDILAGDVAGGQGVVVRPHAKDLEHNVKAFALPLTTTPVEIGPSQGRAWQLLGNPAEQIAGYGNLQYINFDSVARSVAQEIAVLAGEDVQINNAPIAVPARSGGTGWQWANLSNKAVILSYPDKLKLVANENATTAPLYALAMWAEFDLPEDL